MAFKKVAIIHDSFLYIGGAEKVLLVLLKMFPKADVYIPLIRQKYSKLIQKKTKGQLITTPFNKFLFCEKYASFLKPLILLYWESLDLFKYNLVISSSHSFSSKLVKTSPKTLHLAYIHTPPKYLYPEFNEMQAINKQPLKFMLSPFLSILRQLDYKGAQRPDILIANSKVVQKRIKRYYQRSSLVIYPSVKMPNKKTAISKKTKKYYLCFSRLVKQKGTQLAIKTSNDLKYPLVIVGKGPEEKRLKKIAGPAIKFKGFLANNQISKIYSQTKALINCSIDEDFGMTAVEAMAHGIPVIAYKSGGITETVVHKKTGLLFNNFSIASLKQSILKFEKMKFHHKTCRTRAEKFSEKIFIRKFSKLIENTV